MVICAMVARARGALNFQNPDRPGPARPSAGRSRSRERSVSCTAASRWARCRTRWNQTQASTLAGTYGSAHSGASRAAVPLSAAIETPSSWRPDRPIRSTTTVGCMSR